MRDHKEAVVRMMRQETKLLKRAYEPARLAMKYHPVYHGRILAVKAWSRRCTQLEEEWRLRFQTWRNLATAIRFHSLMQLCLLDKERQPDAELPEQERTRLGK